MLAHAIVMIYNYYSVWPFIFTPYLIKKGLIFVRVYSKTPLTDIEIKTPTLWLKTTYLQTGFLDCSILNSITRPPTSALTPVLFRPLLILLSMFYCVCSGLTSKTTANFWKWHPVIIWIPIVNYSKDRSITLTSRKFLCEFYPILMLSQYFCPMRWLDFVSVEVCVASRKAVLFLKILISILCVFPPFLNEVPVLFLRRKWKSQFLE